MHFNYIYEAKRYACLLGCDGEEDSLQHYVRCETFWGLICQTLSREHHEEEPRSFHQLISFLGLESPSERGLRILSSAFYAYHSLKFRASEIEKVNLPTYSDSANVLSPVFPQGGFIAPLGEQTAANMLPPDLITIDVGAAHVIFVGAFRASAILAGLCCPAPSLNENNPTEDVDSGSPARTVRGVVG